MLQKLAALYRLGQRGEVGAGEGQYRETATLGFADLTCEGCTEQDERGCGLPGEERPAAAAWFIDSLGDPRHDRVRTCPAALRVREPVLALAVEELAIWEANGGPAEYFRPLSLAEMPPRISWMWAAYQAVSGRFRAELSRAQARCIRAATDRELDARGFDRGAKDE